MGKQFWRTAQHTASSTYYAQHCVVCGGKALYRGKHAYCKIHKELAVRELQQQPTKRHTYVE